MATALEKPYSTSKPNGLGAQVQTTKMKTLVQRNPKGPSHSLAPAPSSDAFDGELEGENGTSDDNPHMNSLPLPITPAANPINGDFTSASSPLAYSSPSRKVFLYRPLW